MTADNPGTIILMWIVWITCIAAGSMLIRSAFTERSRPGVSRLGQAAHEVRFRLRLAAGVGLLLWVLSGFIWALTH